MNESESKNKISNWHICNSVISSLCGCLASAFFKIGFDFSFLNKDFSIFRTTCILQILLRVFYFLLFIFFNMLMMKFYLQLMKYYSATFSTILNFLFNFLLSALIGYIFFDEKRNRFWFLGVLCIICGLVLIMKDGGKKEKLK